MKLLFTLFLIPSFCFSQISLPEFSSIQHGKTIIYYGGSYTYTEHPSSGIVAEPAPDGWYFSETYEKSFPAPGGDPYVTQPGSLMRFDSTGNKVWPAAIEVDGYSQSLAELPTGNLIHQGITGHWYDGLMSYYVTHFTPSGAVLARMEMPLYPFFIYPETMYNDQAVVQLGSGRLLGTISNLVWSSNAAGTQYWDSISFRFGSMGGMHGLYPAAGEHFYALTDSGLVEYDTLGNVYSHRPSCRGKFLKGYHGDTLIWADGNWLFKADTALAYKDSVATLGRTSKIQLRADGIWVFDSLLVQHYDYALNPMIAVSYPGTWFTPGKVSATDACIAGNKCVVSGSYSYLNACWKTFDLLGNTYDPGYDLRIDTLETDSVYASYMPGGGWGTLSYHLRAIVTNTGTMTIDSVGICNNHHCKVIKGMALLPGQTQTLYFGSSSPPPPVNLTVPYYVHCLVYSPDEKLDANPMDNGFMMRVDIPVGNTPAFSEGQEVVLFPNPVEDVLRVSWQGDVPEQYEVEIVDLAGRLVSAPKVGYSSDCEIIVKQLQPGTYLVRVGVGGSWSWHKMVKM